MRRIAGSTLTKRIVAGEITPARAAQLLDTGMSTLIQELYPSDMGRMTGREIWRAFHLPRIERALWWLRGYPEILPVVEAREVTVNGIRCPGPGVAADWLIRHHHRCWGYAASRLVLAHGDFQPDNMMVSDGGEVTLIDPRGEALLPPEYDLAKVLKVARTPYDALHYSECVPVVVAVPGGVSITVSAPRTWDAHYEAMHNVVVDWLPLFARAQDLTESEFVRAVSGAEWVHYLSFSYHHASRGVEGRRRAIAYLAVASRLARILMDGPYPVTVDDLAQRITLGGE